MKHKIIIIIPWFGRLPNTYPIWRKSVLCNEDIDFYLFTDEKIVGEKNLHVVHTTFEQYVSRIQHFFDFQVACKHSYKLCDYKPVYGEVFEEITRGYDFWGYCDMDMVFGNIRNFLTTELLNTHEKIFVDAHLSLFKNTEKMNHLFREEGVYPEYNYREAYQTNRACFFDEYRGMELKCIRKGIKVYNERNTYANPMPSMNVFVNQGKQVVYLWSDGVLYSMDRKGNKKELLYVHICRRKMESTILDTDENIMILPGRIVSFCSEHINDYFNVVQENKGKYVYKIVWLYRRLRAQMKTTPIFEIIRERKRMRDCRIYKEELLGNKKYNVGDI